MMEDNIVLDGGDSKNLSYLYHGVSIAIAYILPVVVGTAILFPFGGMYSILFPMMIFMWSWKVFIFICLVIIFFKEIIESNIFVSYFVCSLLAYISFFWHSPFLVRAFIGYDTIGVTYEHMFRNGLFILGFPLIYSAISLFIYFRLVKRGIRKLEIREVNSP